MVKTFFWYLRYGRSLEDSILASPHLPSNEWAGSLYVLSPSLPSDIQRCVESFHAVILASSLPILGRKFLCLHSHIFTFIFQIFFYMIYFDVFILKKLLDKKQKSKDFEGLSKSKNRLYFIWKFLTSFLDQNCLYLINHFLIVFINIKFTSHSYVFFNLGNKSLNAFNEGVYILVLETTAAEPWLGNPHPFPSRWVNATWAQLHLFFPSLHQHLGPPIPYRASACAAS